jgi:uncharacterized protein (TIGR02246 family)
MKRLCLFTLTFFLLALTSCKNETNSVDKAQHEEAVRKAINQHWSQYIEKWEQGDATAMAAMSTEDGINMPSLNETQRGRAEIEAFYASFLAPNKFKIVSQITEEVFVHDNMAYEFGTIEFIIQSQNSPMEPVKGRYISVFKQQPDGTWKVHRWLGQQ